MNKWVDMLYPVPRQLCIDVNEQCILAYLVHTGTPCTSLYLRWTKSRILPSCQLAEGLITACHSQAILSTQHHKCASFLPAIIMPDVQVPLTTNRFCAQRPRHEPHGSHTFG